MDDGRDRNCEGMQDNGKGSPGESSGHDAD
jgi:hypothetical protein